MESVIGRLLSGAGDLILNIKKLIETRLLVVSNSGGGKSHLLRKLIELCMGQVQVIVLDVEGDFASLRQKYDFVLAGKGGDIPADPKLAGVLAIKTLELGASLIVDLYELKQHDRIRFVRLFLESMINAPKDLWHPVLVVIDEAHIFAPEKGEAESSGAVIDLATRGRKRGFACVLATQRLSKLHKDAAAECLNKLIGRTGLDIDMKRAADELGFSGREQAHELRSLEPGEFFAYGPALRKEVVRVMVAATETQHPKAGRHGAQRVAAPTAKVKAVLAKLADLPKEAAQEAQDKAALQSKIRELEVKLRQVPKPIVDTAARDRDLSQARAQGIATMQEMARKLVDESFSKLKVDLATKPHQGILKPVVVEAPKPVRAPYAPSTPAPMSTDVTLGRCERAILSVLALRPGHPFTKSQIGARSGYRKTSSGFQNALSKLRTAGLVEGSGDAILLKADVDITGLADVKPQSLQDWRAKLGKCERALYEKLLLNPDLSFTKADLAEGTIYSVTSSGFQNAISRLATLGLLIRHSDKHLMMLNPEVREYV